MHSQGARDDCHQGGVCQGALAERCRTGRTSGLFQLDHDSSSRWHRHLKPDEYCREEQPFGQQPACRGTGEPVTFWLVVCKHDVTSSEKNKKEKTMGRINTIGGLNKVGLDYRPEIGRIQGQGCDAGQDAWRECKGDV